MTFLPSEAQEPKSKSNYTMPLPEGRTKVRVIGSAIVGYEGWSNEGGKKTPIRYKMGEQPEYGQDGKEPKYFWAFVVWNYNQERLQIMAVTQKTIRGQIQALIDDEAWGSPLEYDLSITRTGKEMNDTEYQVMPTPKVKLDPTISGQYLANKIDLQVWMSGGDPFEQKAPQTAVSGDAGYNPQTVAEDIDMLNNTVQ